MKYLIPLFILGILLSLTFTSALNSTSSLTTSNMEMKLDNVAVKDMGTVKVYQVDTEKVRVFRVMENNKMIGRGIILKSDFKEKDLDDITAGRIKMIVDKANREELVIAKPNVLTKLINLIFK